MRFFHFHKWEYAIISCIIKGSDIGLDYEYRVRYCRKCSLIQRETSLGSWVEAESNILEKFKINSDKVFDLIKDLKKTE